MGKIEGGRGAGNGWRRRWKGLWKVNIQPNREVVTVREINEQSNKGKERITDESSRVDSRIGKVTASHDLGSNEGALKLAAKVFKGENNADSPLMKKGNRATEIEVNIGMLNFDPIINAHIAPNQEVEVNPNSLETTLAAPTHENHVTLNVEKLNPTKLMAVAEENPKNIRSWKRIMRQPNPNESIAAYGVGKKRKASTCMVTTHESSHKRLQIQNDHSSSSTMVEDAQQPRQAQ